MRRSKGEAELELQLRGVGLHPEVEYRFSSERRWRFDFAFRAERVAVEVEGAVWTQGRHTRGAGFVADIEKYNSASLLGWLVLRFTPEMVRSGHALMLIESAVKARRAAWGQQARASA